MYGKHLITVHSEVKESQLNLFARDVALLKVWITVLEEAYNDRDAMISGVVDQLVGSIDHPAWFIVDHDALRRVLLKDDFHCGSVS